MLQAYNGICASLVVESFVVKLREWNWWMETSCLQNGAGELDSNRQLGGSLDYVFAVGLWLGWLNWLNLLLRLSIERLLKYRIIVLDPVSFSLNNKVRFQGVFPRSIQSLHALSEESPCRVYDRFGCCWTWSLKLHSTVVSEDIVMLGTESLSSILFQWFSSIIWLSRNCNLWLSFIEQLSRTINEIVIHVDTVYYRSVYFDWRECNFLSMNS